MQLSALLSSLSLLGAALAVPDDTRPLEDRAAKTATVVLDTATVVGNVMNKVESFGGIPYAKPPTGPLRLKPPVRLTGNIGTFDATGPAAACPQMITSSDNQNVLLDLLGDIANLPFVQKATGQTEDCLSITVARPEGTKADAKLPVLYWIFGGGFQLGWSSMYDGTSLVQQSVDIGKPFIFVAVNYRVAGFGFMPGKEILADGSANLGLLDQRMGLEWVADNIAAFGGDPAKVTIWGESAGAISVFDQMALYNGDNKYKGKALFRGAIMNSGSLAPTDPVDCPKGQAVYDKVVAEAGCSGSADTLNCLREVDYTTFLNAVTSLPGILSYNSIALSYLPRPDGRTLTASPDVLAKNGQYAAVPMIIGNQEDEGTLFGLFQANLTSTDKLVSYLKDYFFAGATEDQLRAYVDTYDDGLLSDILNGSPFRTGLFNEIFPGFKRRSAVLGDLVFTLTRRFFLKLAIAAHPDVPSWSYLASYNYGTPILGTFHGSDLIQVFYGIKDNYAARSIRTYYTNFVHALDPNVGSNGQYPNWPKWSQGQNLIQFFADKAGSLKDDFRQASADWIVNNAASLHL
ncbi:carboxylesterase [Colletotrichum higginsianum]|uniref:Carboxylic ester hydrolase n=2 Tax=Colletotrichum higginsianum TaxID=80884 RepID=H1VP91_COLHI|nr:Carboxylic ester hydrolase [Colletotrichum higginsianum IMI 349063]OBR13322.1 Carboxylic ester hydrolase [Colletotrichum higginsianum IMI 349063]TID02826.1 putative secreted lipase [Colletotrichum higginsianum]CCF42045.1 carboxylesterase [Colletotrichum higginsianum]